MREGPCRHRDREADQAAPPARRRAARENRLAGVGHGRRHRGPVSHPPGGQMRIGVGDIAYIEHSSAIIAVLIQMIYAFLLSLLAQCVG